MRFLTKTSRLVAWTGLTAVGALHLAWAAGSNWPERNRKRLGEAVVGSSKMFPSPGATATVGGLALAAGAVAGGALGEGCAVVGARRAIGAALFARAALGGEAFASGLGLPPSGRRFLDLDRRFYRPLCAVLGAATLIGAGGKPRRCARSASTE